MLNIGKLGAGRASYYLSLARGVEDYYTGHGEAPGRWFGHGAEILGLGGTVDADGLTGILEGRRPDSDERLTRTKVPGFDLTFRAPKSVSIIYALDDPTTVAGEVVGAHEAAVDAAIGYLEREACATRRRVNGEITSFAGEGFVAAGFRHRTSRAGDPTLHTHVLVANLARTPDGRWGALDGRHIYRHALTAGYLYQAQLRAELTRRLGVEWGPVTNGCADVAGIPDRVIREFSTRRAEILERMEDRGQWSAKAAQAATLDTRRAKDYQVTPGQLREDWAQRADRLGWGPDRLQDLLDRSGPRIPDLGGVEAIFVELASPNGLTKHASTFTRPDVVRAIASRMVDGADVEQIDRLVDVFVSIADAIPVGEVKGVPTWTTRELLQVEHRLLTGAATRTHDRAGIARRAEVADAIAGRASISDEQADMVAELCLSGRGIDVVIGAAGTGKTYALDTARDAWQRSGFTVHGAALSARAAAELQSGSHIESITLARLLAQIDTGRLVLDHRSVVVVDEAGMVGTRTLDRLHQVTDTARAKLVLVGDPEQLPEIEAGGAFRALTQRPDTIELVDNRRQIEPWERRALHDLRSGHVARAVEAYDQQRRIIMVADPDSLRDRVVADWFASTQAGERALMIAAHRSEVRDLNQRARELLDTAGHLGTTRLIVGSHEFAEGDRVMAVGHNHYDLDILNGDLGTITHLQTDGSVTFRSDRTDSHQTMPIERIQLGLLDHGYARTNHKAQGATVDRTFTLGDDGDLDQQAGYTALSRGRLENRLYVLQPDHDLEPRPPQPDLDLEVGKQDVRRRHVGQELSRDRRQDLASRLLANLPEPEPDLIRREPPGPREPRERPVPSRDIADDRGIDLF
jgi:conjugative relaxase-like TrwC/TraI family protein